MRLQKFFLVAILFLVGTTLNLLASSVNLKTATEAAKNFYYVHNGITLDNSDISLENTITDGLDTTFYIFNYVGKKGFIILSADNAVYPIMGYAFEGQYDKNDIPLQFEWLLSEYHAQLKTIKVQSQIQALPVHAEWTKLLTKATYSTKTTASVAPLTTTTWNQSPYYNDKCPYDSIAKKRTPAGCVGIAMSQTLKYWNHPSQGKGSKSYTSDYGTLSADFGNTTYNWSSMPNSISSSNAEIAQLIYHAGVSVSMDYGIKDGSSAFPTEIDDALKNYFKYASSTKSVAKTSYTDASWEALITNELNNKRVVIISARDSADKVGHAFVCDGYNGSTFHINWGWGGTLNGYFYLNNMVTWSYVWTKSLGAIVGIEPLPSYCSASTTLTDSTGTITDGSGSNDYYENTDCKWLISNSNAKTITLNFKSFATEANYDYVYVYDGATTSAKLIGKYAGTTLPSAITSTGNNLLIHFKTDGALNKAGWEASYTMAFSTSTTTACSGTTTLTAATGAFTDGSGSSNYADDADCKWLIQPSGASTVTLSFSAFSTEEGYDSVKVYDGTSTSAKLLGAYTGTKIPSAVTSTGSSMLVHFTSDYMENAAGFEASYKGNTTSTSIPYASLPYSTSFETGFDKYWKTASSNSIGRIQLTSSNSPYDGSKQLTMDVSKSGTYATNEAWLRLNLAGVSQCYLTFYWKSFSDDVQSTDGVYFSNNGGTSFTKVSSYSTTKNSWVQIKLDIDQLASTAGLSLTSTFVIKFQQYDNAPISSDGMGFDMVNVAAGSLKGTSEISELSNEINPVIIAPNPFSDHTTIYYSIINASTIDMSIYNSLGQKVITLLNETKEVGEYSLDWKGTDAIGNPLSDGIYTCVLKTNNGITSKVIMLNK